MLERLPQGQDWLIEIMQKLGYPGDDRGVCFGLAHMAMQAILADEMTQFDKRLSIIATLTHLTPEELENFFKKYQSLRKQKQNIISEEDLLAEEIPAFFEDIEIYQNPSSYPFLFKREKLPTLPDAILTLPLIIANKLLDQTISITPSFSAAYNENALEQFFYLLSQKLAANNERFAIVMKSLNHVITVGYDPKSKQWLFINPNQLPTKYIAVNEIQTIAKMVLSAFSDNNVVVLSSNIYGLANPQLKNKTALSDIVNTEEWQELHSISEDKIKLVDSNNSSWLYIAAQIGDLKKVKELIAAGADINLTENDKGMSALHIAAQNGYLEIVKQLIASGAKIDLTDSDGETALFVAAKNGHLDTVFQLIDSGANAKLTDNDALTVLTVAVQNNHHEIVQELIAANIGIDVNSTEEDGMTALFHAVKEKNEKTVESLLKADADPDIPVQAHVRTMRNFAARAKVADAMERLIEEKGGLSSSIVTITAKDLAKVMGNQDVLFLLDAYKPSFKPKV